MSRQIQWTRIMSHLLCTCSDFIVFDWIVILLLPTGDAATGCSRYEAGVRWACRTAVRIVLLSVHADHTLYVHTPHPHHPGSKSQKERPWSISSKCEGRQEGCSSRVHKAARTVGRCQRKRSQCVCHQHSHRITGHRVHTVADTDSITCVDKLIVSNLRVAVSITCNQCTCILDRCTTVLQQMYIHIQYKRTRTYIMYVCIY